ncbi:MAG: YbjN domain-containing protein [Fimbriimonadaceae bacterium]|nr:MAG: YbjN domain-containing protein [Fimbriimonadaceae bacterium]
MRMILALTLLLGCLTGLNAFQDTAPIKNPSTESSGQIVTSLTELEIREILAAVPFKGEKITIQEEKDSEGLMAYYVYDDKSILCALYQYSDTEGGPVTSLGLSVGNRLARAADMRKINEWNASRRYVKAYVDREGDAMLSADLLLTTGVTKVTVKEWVRMFGEFSHEFTTFLKN